MTINFLQEKYYNILQKKYHVDKPLNTFKNSDFLYIILRKAELSFEITDLELDWLVRNGFHVAKDIIKIQNELLEYHSQDSQRLRSEFTDLGNRYMIPQTMDLELSSPIYSILWKVELGDIPTPSDLDIIKEYGLKQTALFLQECLNFSRLKDKFHASQYSCNFALDPLHAILKKLKQQKQLSESEKNWLASKNLKETLKIYEEQQQKIQDKAEFQALKKKYRLQDYQDSSIDSPLYGILKNLDNGTALTSDHRQWLKKKNLFSILEIDDQRLRKNLLQKLRLRYYINSVHDVNQSDQLFAVLVHMAWSDPSLVIPEILELPETFKSNLQIEDIEWLNLNKYHKAAEIAQKIHFKFLKHKYRIIILEDLPVDPFYKIMIKLEKNQRLDPKQVIQLIETRQLLAHGEIAKGYHRLEANFYQNDYQKTGNKWSLASASSHWRKADQPYSALKTTANIEWDQIKDLKLKSALLVTRGATFRDLGKLDEAESHAKQAMDCHPQSHQPYTLLGAISYTQGKYLQGDRYFAMAQKRGAKDTDDEIQKVVRTTKDKKQREEVAEYLWKKDKKRYAWAQVYIKNPLDES